MEHVLPVFLSSYQMEKRLVKSISSEVLVGLKTRKCHCLIAVISQFPHSEYWLKVTGQEVIMLWQMLVRATNQYDSLCTLVLWCHDSNLCFRKLPNHYT
jgi:hypothetical protein